MQFASPTIVQKSLGDSYYVAPLVTPLSFLSSTIPEVGGHTNFRNAAVHVKPTFGSAVFFSYIDPEALVMDNGFTEHSGCPVFEGEKKIVTQWVRYGVNAEHPWDSFNTCKLFFCASNSIFVIPTKG